MTKPDEMRPRATGFFGFIEELEEPERLILPVLLDGVSIVEACRRVRHQVTKPAGVDARHRCASEGARYRAEDEGMDQLDRRTIIVNLDEAAKSAELIRQKTRGLWTTDLCRQRAFFPLEFSV